MTTALITGGGSGIGQALAWQLAGKGFNVIIIGRTASRLEATQQKFPDQIKIIKADISQPQDRQNIVDALQQAIDLQYVIHNAALVKPFSPVQKLGLDQWRQAMAVNVEAPIFLTQSLVPMMKAGRVLHISTGLAHRAFAGMAAYCISKAALHMAYLVCQQDYADSAIKFGSVMPGTVDTPMQQDLRSAGQQDLPVQAFFKALKTDDKLLSPAMVAHRIAKFLLETDDSTFTEKDWRIEQLLD